MAVDHLCDISFLARGNCCPWNGSPESETRSGWLLLRATLLIKVQCLCVFCGIWLSRCVFSTTLAVRNRQVWSDKLDRRCHQDQHAPLFADLALTYRKRALPLAWTWGDSARGHSSTRVTCAVGLYAFVLAIGGPDRAGEQWLPGGLLQDLSLLGAESLMWRGEGNAVEFVHPR